MHQTLHRSDLDCIQIGIDRYYEEWIGRGETVLDHDPRHRRAERVRRWILALAALISALAAVLTLLK